MVGDGEDGKSAIRWPDSHVRHSIILHSPVVCGDTDRNQRGDITLIPVGIVVVIAGAIMILQEIGVHCGKDICQHGCRGFFVGFAPATIVR